MRLDAVCTKSSIQKMMTQGFCGFHKITRQQLETVSTKGVIEIRQFILPDDEDLTRKRLKQTEDGRSYFYYTLTKNQDGLSEHAKCALKL
jgi:hypothetical protein